MHLAIQTADRLSLAETDWKSIGKLNITDTLHTSVFFPHSNLNHYKLTLSHISHVLNYPNLTKTNVTTILLRNTGLSHLDGLKLNFTL